MGAVTAFLTGLSATALLFSIAASQILLGIALLCLLLTRRSLAFPARLRWPLLAFAATVGSLTGWVTVRLPAAQFDTAHLEAS